MVTLCTTEFEVEKFHVLPHTVHLRVFYGFQNKKGLSPYTALTDWFINGDG